MFMNPLVQANVSYLARVLNVCKRGGEALKLLDLNITLTYYFLRFLKLEVSEVWDLCLRIFLKAHTVSFHVETQPQGQLSKTLE